MLQSVKDMFGSAVSIGDYLLHYTKKSIEVDVHYSVIYGYVWRGDEYIELKVVSVKKLDSGALKYYRTTLTVNNFVRVTADSVPNYMKLGLLDKVKV